MHVKGRCVEYSALVLGVFFLVSSAHGQVPPPPLDRPADRPLPLPKDEPDQPAPKLELPPLETEPAAAAPDGVRDLTRARIHAREFRFVGNTAFSSTQLAAITAPFLEREIDSDDLEAIRVALTRHYIEHGYINSGAILPDQTIADGVITYQLIEGRLTAVEVIGLHRLRADYVRDRVALDANQPLNVYTIRDRLFLLQQDPRILRLDGVLLPGVRPGEASLRVNVDESAGGEAYFTLNNHRPPSVGAERGEIALLDYNFLGLGDSLTLRAGQTDGSNDLDLGYAVLLDSRDTTLNLRYTRSDSRVIEAPFDQLNAQSKSHTAGIGVWHFLRKQPQLELSLGLSFEQRKSEGFLLGEPFAFSQGTPADGQVRLSVLRFAQSWLRHDNERVIVARSTLSDGIAVANATIDHNAEPDGRFLAWLGQLQWVERLSGHKDEVLVRTDVQLSKEPLPALEQLAVGGANSVRGYRENEQVRDSGVFASLEIRHEVWADPSRGRRVQLAAFYDHARSWNRDRPTPGPGTLSSVGLGVRGTAPSWLEFELYYGKRLERVDTSGANLQDKGIHLQVRARIW